MFRKRELPLKKLLRNSLTIVVIISLLSENVADGQKNKNKAKGTQKGDEGTKMRKESEDKKQTKDYECPAKVARDTGEGTSKKIDQSVDESAVELVGMLKQYLYSGVMNGVVPEAFDRKFRINSAIWFLKRTVGEMLSFITDEKDGKYKENVQLISAKWDELFEKKVTNDAGKREQICHFFQFATNLRKNLPFFLTKNLAAFEEYLVESRIDKVMLISQKSANLVGVACDTAIQIEEAFNALVEPPTILTIHGQNIGNLLSIDENLRRFLCHEIQINSAKAILQGIVSNAEMTALEDKFPRIIRLDLVIPTTVLHRFNTLLAHKSDTAVFKTNFLRWTISLLIWDINRKLNSLRNLFGTIRLIGFDKFVDQTKALVNDVFHDVQSEQNACMLIKLFELKVEESRVFHRIDALVPQWRADCAQQGENIEEESSGASATLRRFVTQQNGSMYQQSLSLAFHMGDKRQIAEAAKLMQLAGAKTRLKKVLGTQKRAENFLGECSLANIYRHDNVFLDNDRLWEHYEFCLMEAQSGDCQWHKLGADIVVLMRWVERRMEDQIGTDKLQLIKQHVDNEVYDPLFDQGPDQMEAYDQFVDRLIIDTKTLVTKMVHEKRGGDGEQKAQKGIVKQWKLMVENGREAIFEQTVKSRRDENLGQQQQQQQQQKQHISNREWLCQLNGHEFWTLTGPNGEKVENLKELVTLHGRATVFEWLLMFVDERMATHILDRSSPSSSTTETAAAQQIGDDQQQQQQKREEGAQRMGENEASNGEKQLLETEISIDQQQQDEGQRTVPTAENSDDGDQWAKQMHIKCPANELTIEQLKEIDKEKNPNGHFFEWLMNVLRDFLTASSFQMAFLYSLVEQLCAIWYLNLYAHQTLNVMEKMEPKGSVFEMEATKLKAHYNTLINMDMEQHNVISGNSGEEERGQQQGEGERTMHTGNPNVIRSLVVIVFRFNEHIANNKILFENSAKWNAYRWAKLTNWIGTEITEPWATPKFSEEEANKIFMLLRRDNAQLVMNMACVSTTIRQFAEFRRFLCALPVPNRMQTVKTNLGVLLHEEQLMTLEEHYPEVLQFVKTSEVLRYKHLLKQRTGTEQAFFAGVRLTLPILMKKMKIFVEQQSRKLVKNRHAPIILALEKAMEKVRLDAFLSLRTVQAQAKAFCMVHKFIKYSEKALELYRKTDGKELDKLVTAIVNWRAKKCEDVEEQFRIFQEQNKELSIEHFALLSLYLTENVAKIVDFVRNTRGAPTRVKKFINETNVLSNFMQTIASQIRNPFNFYEHQSSFVDAIFGEEAVTRLAGKLSVFIAVWVLWLDEELSEETESRTTGLKMVEEILWTKKREQMEQIYDEIMDDPLEVLERKNVEIRAMFRRIFQFVSAKKRERRWTSRRGKCHHRSKGGEEDSLELVNEWNKYVEEAATPPPQMGIAKKGTDDDDPSAVFELLDSQLQFEALFEQLSHAEFRQRFKYVEKDEIAIERMLEFVPSNIVEDVLTLLNYDDWDQFEKNIHFKIDQAATNVETNATDQNMMMRKTIETMGEEKETKKKHNRKQRKKQSKRVKEGEQEEGEEEEEEESDQLTGREKEREGGDEQEREKGKSREREEEGTTSDRKGKEEEGDQLTGREKEREGGDEQEREKGKSREREEEGTTSDRKGKEERRETNDSREKESGTAAQRDKNGGQKRESSSSREQQGASEKNSSEREERESEQGKEKSTTKEKGKEKKTDQNIRHLLWTERQTANERNSAHQRNINGKGNSGEKVICGGQMAKEWNNEAQKSTNDNSSSSIKMNESAEQSQKVVAKQQSTENSGSKKEEQETLGKNDGQSSESSSATAEHKNNGAEKKCGHILSGDQLTNANLKGFILDGNLRSLYSDFLTHPTDQKQCVLNIGVYVNEVWHRMEVIDQINNYFANWTAQNGANGVGWEKVPNLRTEWRGMEHQLEEVEQMAPKWEEGDGKRVEGFIDQIERTLYKMLKKLIFLAEGFRSLKDGREEREEKWEEEGDNADNEGAQMMCQKEQQSVAMQLHRNNLAKTIIWQQKLASKNKSDNNDSDNNLKNGNWHNLDGNKQGDILKMIFFNSKNDKKLAKRFNEHLDNWEKLLAQQRIDSKLLDQFHEFTRDNLAGTEPPQLGVQFAENTQQIYFNNANDDQIHLSMINELLTENGFTECQSAENALKEVKEVVAKWSNNEARLVETGSYSLGAHTRGSDIDAICVVPQNLGQREEKKRFYGATSFCDLDRKASERNCEDGSLYCHFCKHPKVKFLKKIPSIYVPLIELKLSHTEFDLSFVAIPHMGHQSLPNEPIRTNEVHAMMHILANQTDRQQPMLNALSGYLANNAIKKIIEHRDFAKFKNLLWLTKFWAKSNYIYGNQFGLFNGISLTILSTKIFLYYPNASVPFLFEKFIFIIQTWNWPMPVQIDGEDKEKGGIAIEHFKWKPSAIELSNGEMQMPIITPQGASQNAGKFINKSTKKIIEGQLRQTLVQLRTLRNMPSSLVGKNEWAKLFPAQEFTEKYRHFVTIACIGSTKEQILQFCGFVERKLRAQLLHIDHILAGFVAYSHIKSDETLANGGYQCPAQIKRENREFIRNPLCKSWLVGIRMTNEESHLEESLAKYINDILAKEFDAKIREQYSEIVLKRSYQCIKLESKFVGKNELGKRWDNVQQQSERSSITE